MKEMMKRVREERGGFTLAELLIVVAIVAVLVAIAVPVFTGALGGANEAVGQAAVRSVKAEAVSALLLDKTVADKSGDHPYYATVNKDGSVTDLTPGTKEGALVEGTATPEEIGEAIGTGSAVVQVTVSGENVSGTTTNP